MPDSDRIAAWGLGWSGCCEGEEDVRVLVIGLSGSTGAIVVDQINNHIVNDRPTSIGYTQSN